MISGRDILLLSTADWDAPLWTNKQHVAKRLAGRNRVFYVESLGLRRPRLSWADANRILRRLLGRSVRPPQASGPEVLSPLCLPFWGSASARALNAAYLSRYLGAALRERAVCDYILWTYVPFASLLIDRLKPRPAKIVYHCADDLSAFPGIPADAVTAAERDLCRRADIVFFSSRGRRDMLAPLCRRAIFVGNVAEAPRAVAASAPPELDALPRPRVGFAGAIDSAKLDWKVLEFLGSPAFSGSIILIGPLAATEDPARLDDLRRGGKVLWLGGKSHEEMLSLLACCDVLAVPYRLNEYTRFVFPMKLFEYLGLGKPVISTALPEVEPFAPLVTIAGSPEDFARAAISELSNDEIAKRYDRIALARAHTWDSLLERISAELEEPVGAPQ